MSPSKFSKRISNNAVVKQKHRKPNVSKITNNNQVAKMSRKYLLNSLAEIGILIPPDIKTDVLRLLYETNIIEDQQKKKNKLPIASGMAKPHHDRHAASVDDSSDDDTHRIDDINVNYNKMNPAAIQDEEEDHIMARQQKISNEFAHQAALKNNINNNSGKPFTLFSAPTAEENLHIGTSGLSVRGDSDLETVPKGLRKAIIEGYNVNLVRLLLPRDNKKYSRNDDDDEDKNVYLKQKDDPCLDKNLTISEFILAFTRYLNIICEVFPQRRRELTAYLCDIIRLSSRFGHPFFYHYHRLFAQKTETLLQTRNILIDWSKRDHDIYFNVFSGLRPIVCDLCRSPDHSTSFCKKILNRDDLIEKILSENQSHFTSTTSSKVSFLQALGSDDVKQDSGPTFTGCSTNIPLIATTPINICRLEHELAGHPDKKFTSFLLSGLCEGFDTARRDPKNVTCLVAEELNKGFLIGRYNSPPFINYRINPIGLVESKYSKKKRLIFDLSAPHNDKDHPSINSLSYVTVDDAIKSIQKFGKGAWMNKADIQDAFKLLPIKPSLWPFYGLKWNSHYYFFLRLPFGSRSSPKLFDMLSAAIVWIAEHNYGLKKMLHLLDDFFVVDSRNDGGERTSVMISLIFNRLKIPLSVHKTVGPAQEIEYLGIILDSNRMEARLPQAKVLRIMEMIKSLLNRRKCKKCELLVILGHMSFASRVVIPGRTFVHYLFNLTPYVRSLESHITIDRQAQLELIMWYRHLSEWNGTFFVLDPNIFSNTGLAFSTDASTTVGCGAVFGNE
ncbi:unnamed protein product [Rotaria sp. Silwood2]|nr:unnamed protein product [Rotaria sp. Silwood2]